jgi:hypothetical protein
MLVFEKAAMFLDINVVRVRAAWKKNERRKEREEEDRKKCEMVIE